MIWTEVEGTVTINNRQFRGAAGFTLTVSDELAPWYGIAQGSTTWCRDGVRSPCRTSRSW